MTNYNKKKLKNGSIFILFFTLIKISASAVEAKHVCFFLRIVDFKRILESMGINKCLAFYVLFHIIIYG